MLLIVVSRLDIAAAHIPANIIPETPAGNRLITKYGNTCVSCAATLAGNGSGWI